MSARTIIRKLVPVGLFDAVAPWGHLVEAVLWNCRYGFPARGMKVVGVTGTNGKTTTSFLIHRMLHEAGYHVGLMTTVAWVIDGETQPQGQQHMTNVPIPVLMKRLKKMRAEGVEWLVLETTSHALIQHRTWGVRYSVGVLTNITHEHLDYHKTFERYVAAKQLLFKRVQRNRRGLQTGIANADDPNGASFAALTQNSVLYGVEAGQVRAANIRMSADGISYEVQADGETYHIASHLPGSFNVYNTLAALCVGRVLGLKREQIEQGITALESVQGRMQQLKAGQPFQIIIDYAHTPDALQNVLTSLQATGKGRRILVFGATGDRDKTKRPVMGEVAGKLADRIFLTDDETYTEDGDVIRKAVYEGIKTAEAEDKTTVIADRREAIAAALKEAREGDVVVLTGIGHQQYRMMDGKEMAWSEADVATEALTSTAKSR
ncbi:MAG: UDP-N-acetylmuramoyl-L-alanyl-D-glutamate--2,6-diaminopimelate ligase [Candidatus Saccharibacteria bacterium]